MLRQVIPYASARRMVKRGSCRFINYSAQITKEFDEVITNLALALALGYKNRQPHVSTFFRLVLIPQLHNFCVDRQTYSYISLFNMVQIKLSVALRVILVAAVITPVVALPVITDVSPQTESVLKWHS